jgi:anti-sigma regulatory factor (Ser/Thr protein kinase)
MGVTSVRLVPGAESARAARRVVSEICKRGDLDRIADDACLVVSELVTNAAMHGGTTIDLTLRATGEGLRIEVADGSSDRAFVAVPGVNALGGRGLAVVDQLARTWGSDPHSWGKVVWAEVAAV